MSDHNEKEKEKKLDLEGPVQRARDFRQKFNETILLTRKGNSYNQRQIVEMIEKYWDSEFINGDQSGDLFRFFYNIIKFPTRISAKMTDFDTKDIRAVAEAGQSHVPVYLYNKELKNWMKDQNFGHVLNRIVNQTPKYGNTVLKVVNGDVKLVRLVNLINDPYVEHLKDSAIIEEKHFMTPDDLRQQKGWDKDKVKEAIVQFAKAKGDRSYLEISEIYIYAPKKFFNEKSKSEDYVRGMIIVSGLDDVEYSKKLGTEKKGYIVKDNSIILFKGVKKVPYYEFFWDDYQGRWLRVGVPEELLEEQMSMNEASFLEYKGLYWTSKHLFQTKDMIASKNLLRDVEDGQVMRVNNEITPIKTEERNLAAFRNQFDIWDKNRKEKTFSFETVSGETLPSGTPFRSAFIQQSAAGGYFDSKREDIGLMLKKLIVEVITPTFKKSKKTAHLFNISGEDSEFASLEELLVEFKIFEAVKKSVEAGKIPSLDEVDRVRANIKEKLSKKVDKVLKVPEGYYEDLKIKTDIVITDESVALDSKMQTLTTVMQTIATNPSILENETTKRMLFKILDFAGVSPEELRGAATPPTAPPTGPAQTFSPPPAGRGGDIQSGGPGGQITL